MNSTLKSILSGEEFPGIDRIEIPQIQRDYAQGRLTQKASDIRQAFLDNILSVVMASDSDARLHLDFIYGYKGENHAFEPLDGQQRITTLFLLYWLFSPAGNADLIYRDENKEVRSKLRYCTRGSSTDFCDFLVKKDSSILLGKIRLQRNLLESEIESCQDKKQKDKLKEKLAAITLSSKIKDSEEFQWNWHYDPTVEAMLNMLDAAEENLRVYGIDKPSDYYVNLSSRLTMDFQDLEDLEFGKTTSLQANDKKLRNYQGYELYVKMNSRGLELSDFDITKSIFEEELIDQKIPDALQEKWRKLIDKEWADFFWQKFQKSGQSINETNVALIETEFRNFLLQVISLDWFMKLYVPTHTEKQAAIYALTINSGDDIDRIIPVYRNLLFRERHDGLSDEKYLPIDFNNTISYINAILQKEPGSKKISSINEYAGENNRGIIDSYIYPLFSHTSSHVDRVLFWAITRYSLLLKGEAGLLTSGVASHNELPQPEGDSDAGNNPKHFSSNHDLFKTNLRKWMRFIYHITILANNTERLDTNKKEFDAITGINDFLTKFYASPQLDIDDFIIKNKITNFTLANIEEEQLKINLKQKNSSWIPVLEEAENHSYLKGQLRAFLDWSKTIPEEGTTVYDIEKFKKYYHYFDALYSDYMNGLISLDDIRGALLATNDPSYPMNTYLLDFSEHRDRSIKRYLREKDANGTYAEALKVFLDAWIDHDPNKKAYEMVADYIKKQSALAEPWKQKLIEVRSVINSYSGTGRIFNLPDDWMLGNAWRSDSHLYSLELLYYNQTRLAGKDCSVKDNIAASNPNTITDNATGDVVISLDDLKNANP